MYGLFFEDINFAADGGLYAEMVKNRSFEFYLTKTGWREPNTNRHDYNNDSGLLSTVKYAKKSTNHNYGRVKVKGPNYALINEDFKGMGIKKNAKYNLSLEAAKHNGDINKINFQFIDDAGEVVDEASIVPEGKNWKSYEDQLIASKTVMKAQLKLTFEGMGTIDLDMISLFPEDTWNGIKKGLRKDIVELLDGINTGFLRFTGGVYRGGKDLGRTLSMERNSRAY